MVFPITQTMRAERRKRAEERQAEYDKLTLQQKLEKLPAEPHATKQRAKLLRQLEAKQFKQVVQEGLKDSDEGKTVSHEQVKKNVKNKYSKKGDSQ